MSAKARRATAGLDTSRWSEIRPPPRKWTLPAVRTSAESSARRQHAFRGSIPASSARTSSESMLEIEKAPFVLGAERPVAAEAARGDHAMIRHDEGEAVLRAERAGGSLRVRVARKGSELP